MKKVDNEIQKELSYNYHTAFEADRGKQTAIDSQQ